MARVIETNMIEAYRELHRFLGACNDGRARQTINYTYLVYDKDQAVSYTHLTLPTNREV